MQVTYKAVPYQKARSLLLSNVSTTGWNRPVLTEGCMGGLPNFLSSNEPNFQTLSANLHHSVVTN